MAIKFQTRGASDDALSKLLELSKYYEDADARELTRLTNRQTNIVNQLNTANTSQELSNLQPLISELNNWRFAALTIKSG